MESAESFIDEKKTQKHLPEPALVLGDDHEQQQQYKEPLHDPRPRPFWINQSRYNTSENCNPFSDYLRESRD